MDMQDYLKQLTANTDAAITLLSKNIEGVDHFLLSQTNGLSPDQAAQVNAIRDVLKNGMSMAKSGDMSGLENAINKIKDVSKNN